MHGEPALGIAAEAAASFLRSLDDRHVGSRADQAQIQERLDGDLPQHGRPPEEVVRDLVAALEPGLVASAGPRYFGFVTGGALPVSVAADWLTSAWDQNAGLQVMSPSAAAVEEIAAQWVLQALSLPPTASVGFVTGATMANLVGLAAGRHRLLADAGWDVEEHGLQGGPSLDLVCGEEVHASLLNAAQCAGLGRATWKRVAVDDQGRMRPDELRSVLDDCRGPILVAAQAGNVNSGAFDPLEEISEACRSHGAWLHVDGAFGLWVRAGERSSGLAAGAERADSWAVDAHKWLNVPYDCGIAVVADPEAHRAATTIGAAYLLTGAGRDGMDWVPEASRRARALPVYAALSHLGRTGLADLVERCCSLARRFADRLDRADGISVLNEVVINQVVVAFDPSCGTDPVVFRDRVAAALQEEGTCWAGGTTWRGRPALRISVSNWRTTEADVDRSAEAIVEAVGRLTADRG